MGVLIRHLNQAGIKSIQLSLIVKSRLNPFLEQTSTMGKVSCSMKPREPLVGFEPSTDSYLTLC